jgi:hypothetical protein
MVISVRDSCLNGLRDPQDYIHWFYGKETPWVMELKMPFAKTVTLSVV